MAEDRSVSLGLNTDDPPDRLGDQAWYCENVLPGSQTTVKPRPGSSLVAHYLPTGTVGRYIIADALPDDAGNGVLIVCVYRSAAGTENSVAVHGLKAWKPAIISSEYSAVSGYDNFT